MDDQQMDQWFADKLKKEKEFDYREADWESISDRMDRQEEGGKRRRLLWVWWPIGIAASMVIGLFFWQQQQQIIDLRKQLSELQLLDTVQKMIIIQDTIRKTITLPEEKTGSFNSRKNLELQGISNSVSNSQTSEKLITSDAKPKSASEKSTNENTALDKTPQNISNSSVVKGRPQLSAVDSSAELPTFFSADDERQTVDGQRQTMDGVRETPARLSEAGQTGDGKRETVDGKRQTPARITEVGRTVDGQRETPTRLIEAGQTVDGVWETGPEETKFLVLTKLPIPEPEALRMGNTIPDIMEVNYQKAPTSITTPIRKWKPVFELDAALGLGQPEINISNLFDRGQTISYNLGAGLSMQTVKRLWVRIGVSHQTHRYYSNVPDAASAYVSDDNSDIELLRDSSQFNPSASSLVNSIRDKNQYWQYELGLRYNWLQRKKWSAYVRSDMLSRFVQDRNTELKVLSAQSNGLDMTLASETINSSQKGFSVIGLQLGTGANYRLNKHWQLSLEGNVILNTDQVASSSVLLPNWDLRIGSRFNF